jgi:hypothetical protein
VSEANLNQVLFKGGRIYQHNVFRVNYTTYDLDRRQDNFNPNSDHRDIIMLAGRPEEESQVASPRFCYARIVGIYHANVQYIGPGLKNYNATRLDFLHIRWFELVPPCARQDRAPLDMLRFVPSNTTDAFDFVDPAEVLRGCHLIPAFAKGRLDSDDTVSAPLSCGWKYYYINK